MITARGAKLVSMERATNRVLVVDDEPNISDLISTAIRYEGFEVATGAG